MKNEIYGTAAPATLSVRTFARGFPCDGPGVAYGAASRRLAEMACRGGRAASLVDLCGNGVAIAGEFLGNGEFVDVEEAVAGGNVAGGVLQSVKGEDVKNPDVRTCVRRRALRVQPVPSPAQQHASVRMLDVRTWRPPV